MTSNCSRFFKETTPEQLREHTFSKQVSQPEIAYTTFFFEEFWNQNTTTELALIFFLEPHKNSKMVVVPSHFADKLESATDLKQAFEDVVKRSDAAVLDIGMPLLFDPVEVPKPWGKEVWYTGMEARGVSNFTDGKGITPIPWILAAFPSLLGLSQIRNLILLKVLAPHPHEALGDLYMELHTEKWETYIVTKVAKKTWPSGSAHMFLGIAEEKLLEFQNNETALKQSYLNAIRNYEKIRRQIDAHLNMFRNTAGFKKNDVIPIDIMESWLEKIPENLRQEEKLSRENMQSFVGKLVVKEGDIIQVPVRHLHGLRHGIEVVEFQSQTYERYIVSFNQQVVTQDHWDSETALDLVTLKKPERKSPLQLESRDGIRVEQVVDFPEFAAERWTIAPRKTFFKTKSNCYSLIFAVKGDVSIHWGHAQKTFLLREGLAAFLPKHDLFNVSFLSMTNSEDTILLCATPKLGE